MFGRVSSEAADIRYLEYRPAGSQLPNCIYVPRRIAAYYIKQAAQQVIVPVITALANVRLQNARGEGWAQARERERERERERRGGINNFPNNQRTLSHERHIFVTGLLFVGVGICGPVERGLERRTLAPRCHLAAITRPKVTNDAVAAPLESHVSRAGGGNLRRVTC